MPDLYRHYDKNGALLYVGRSLNAVNRLSAHRRVSSWYGEIATVTIEKVSGSKALAAAERRAIANENPVYNVLLRPKVKKKRKTRKKKVLKTASARPCSVVSDHPRTSSFLAYKAEQWAKENPVVMDDMLTRANERLNAADPKAKAMSTQSLWNWKSKKFPGYMSEADTPIKPK